MMKKLLVPILGGLLLLSAVGCAGKNEQTASQNQTQEQSKAKESSGSSLFKKKYLLKELEGVWKKGTSTVSEVSIPDDVRNKAIAKNESAQATDSAQDQGEKTNCTYDMIKSLDEAKGKPFLAKIAVFPEGDNGGLLALSMADVKEPTKEPADPKKPETEEEKKDQKFTYDNNTISIKGSNKGLEYELNLVAMPDGSGIKLEGEYIITSTQDNAKVVLKMSYAR